MKKKVIATMLICTLFAGVLGGCGETEGQVEEKPSSGEQEGIRKEDTEEESGQDGEAASYEEPLTISAWMHTDDNEDGYLSDTNENPVIAYISEKFNVTFEWQIPATGSESSQMSLMIGSKDYTDVFDATFSQQSCQELYEDGVIVDLTPYAEEYMPNYMAYIQSSETLLKSAYADGKILYIPNVENEPTLSWGGMMYNRKILEDMTGGNIQFPSGKEEPETVADWEYMLDLMKQYYEQSGLTDYACLIIPANGFFQTGDIVTGFGTTGYFYLDDDKKVRCGLTDDGFYHYLVKMREWYEKGYIYQDFASRGDDPFYFPNSALTYTGAAGIYYGLLSSLYGGMNIPEYGMEFDFRALTSPLDEENNAKMLPANTMVASNEGNESFTNGWVVSSACSEEKLIRWLQICDYLFSDEGSMMKSYGLTKEQAEGNAVYAKLGMEDGAYWFDEEGNFQYNPVSDPFSETRTVKEEQLRLHRLPGLYNKTYYNQKTDEGTLGADRIWMSGGGEACIPSGAVMTVEEGNTYAPLWTAINDYVSEIVPKFIMGKEGLTPESFQAFKDQIEALGLDTCIEIQQKAYDRYME